MSPQKIDNLLVWGSDIDANTIEQAKLASRLPFVPAHLALMPDAHVGMGATVGSVIPTMGAIIPSAVGVDIGCVDASTEVLTQRGWRRIDDNYELSFSKIAQYNLETGKAEFVEPEAYIVREQEKFLYLHTKYGIDQMLTPDHKMIVWEVKDRDRRLEQRILTAQEFYDRHTQLKQGYKAKFQTSFGPPDTLGLNLTDAELRLQVAINADTHLDKQQNAVVKLRKSRKIERLEKLLADTELKYSKKEYRGDTTFRFIPPLNTKSFNYFWWCTGDQLSLVAEEVLKWDGNEEDRVFFTRNKDSADFIHYCFAACGFRSVMRKDGEDYRVYCHLESMVSMGGVPKTEIDIVPSSDGKAYCFTVPSGFLIFRRNGNIFISGNCGMVAAETTLMESDLPDNLDEVIKLYDKRIPAGVGQGFKTSSGWQKKIEESLGWPQGTDLLDKQKDTCAKQFGTLGAGNHFVEICLDERKVVWMVLHSGSRGIGNQLATTHITKAKKIMKQYFIELEDPDLAYLVQGTDDFKRYISDMLWSQNYALDNRELMANVAVSTLFEVVGKGSIVRDINCHHNFTQMEHHHGKNMWITRKGAIKAAEGDLGVIPGSMGTRSYIVRGKGNPASYHSCSHGAGRRLSRGQARKQLTVESLREAMSGKSWLENRADKLIDESPAAYKDIDKVMDDQKDLVEIIHTLRQVANYKGI